MQSRTLKRGLGLKLALAGTLAAATVGVSVPANASPIPDSGPIEGETVVTLPLPTHSFTHIAAGQWDSWAIDQNGHVYAWGGNYSGQLDESSIDQLSPRLVNSPAGVTFSQLDGIGLFTLAVGSDGNVYRWGLDPASGSAEYPGVVTSPEEVTFTQISGGFAHSLAIGSDGKTYAWGQGTRGELGDDSLSSSFMPIEVATPSGVTFTQVDAGSYVSMAVGSDGKIYTWGANPEGYIGDGSTTDVSRPVAVQTPSGVTFTQVDAGPLGTAMYALSSDGDIYAWGHNSGGQLGDGTQVDSPIPVLVDAPDGVKFKQVVGVGGGAFGIGTDGNTYAWGSNGNGLLGNGDASQTTALSPVLVQAPPGVEFQKIAAGVGHALAIGSDGKTYAWGLNVMGSVGNGTNTGIVSTPVPVLQSAVEVTEVAFAGVPGTDLKINEDGTMTVRTPPHARGPVDVVVNWSVDESAQQPIEYPGGFTYMDSHLNVAKNSSISQASEGDSILYTLTATNDGDYTLEDVTLQDVNFNGVSELSPLECDISAPVALAPGDSLTCTTNYKVSGGDVSYLTNGATGSGVTPQNSTVSDSSTTVVKVLDPDPIAPNEEVDDNKSGEGKSSVDGKPTTRPGASLAITGSTSPWDYFGLGALLFVAGSVLLVLRRRLKA